MMVVDNSSCLGLPATRALALLEPLGCAGLDTERTLAFVIWSHLCEPGEMLAGALVQRLGPDTAIAAIRRPNGVGALVSELRKRDAADDLVSRGEAFELELAEAIKRWRDRDNNAAVLRSLEAWNRLGGQVVTPDSFDWPERLDDLGAGSPHALWLRGNRAALGSLTDAVAIVGSRNVTSYGQHCASSIAERLVDAGFAIVSGGAYGIDAEAHRGAVAAEGITVAVLAGGADRLYPIGNTQLLGEVMQKGCVIAEQPPGNAPTRWRFLQRNRLIAALGQATVVVEMALKSGAKNTMHHAMELGREVYAVPGSLVSQTARGCNVAIAEQKAKIVTGFDDLVRELLNQPLEYESSRELTALQQRVLDALSDRSAPIVRISVKAGTSIGETTLALHELEFKDLATQNKSGWRRSQPLALESEPDQRQEQRGG